jgi:hypothetical protein
LQHLRGELPKTQTNPQRGWHAYTIRLQEFDMGLRNWFQARNYSEVPDSNPARPQPGPVPVSSTASAPEPIPDFDRAVDDAMCLLMYAAETGKTVDDTTRASILHAKTATSAGADDTVTANLLAALTKLAAALSPVTADSLRASSSQTKPTIRSLRMWTCILAVPIMLFSVLAFVSSSISTAIRTDITTANELLIKLRGELGTPAAPTAGTPDAPALPKGLNEGDVVTQLQQYASTIRAIDARSRQLNWFVFRTEWDPFAKYRFDPKENETDRVSNQQEIKKMFQLPVGLPNMPKALDTLTTTYQDVRSFAQDILDLVSVYYGAIATCLLPVLYALLGTCAYLLRSFEEELRTLTFMPSSRANWARFLIAGIGGAVVGLFSNFTITQGASISPLAIAFLVGYAVDVFFSFLESLLQAFTKRKGNTGSPAAGTSTG